MREDGLVGTGTLELCQSAAANNAAPIGKKHQQTIINSAQ
jgi:hypothetical protein